MNEADLARRIYDNLNWAQGVEPNPVFSQRARPADVWSQVQAVWEEPDPAFVEGLYLILLSRRADPAGLELWCAALAGGLSRAELVRTLAQSHEVRRTRLDVSWLSRLPAPPPPPRRPLPLRVWGAVWRRCKALRPGALWSKVKAGARRFRAGKESPL